jgi:ABC-2 type transport system permease protein
MWNWLSERLQILIELPMFAAFGALLGHRPVTALWGTGGLVWLLVTAAVYLAAGILAFRLCERTAKTRGTLARY